MKDVHTMFNIIAQKGPKNSKIKKKPTCTHIVRRESDTDRETEPNVILEEGLEE